jgi:Uma2 family endonuclease
MHAFKPHKLTTAEYFSIGELSTKTELINGVIYDMVPPGPNHSHTVRELSKQLVLSLNNEIVSQEQPLQLLPDNAPQPDVAILKPAEDGYRNAHPLAKDVLVIIEVSDSTLNYDLNEKMSLYASGLIPLYYVVDLENKTIVKHSLPLNNKYQSIEHCQEILIDDLSVTILMDDIL